MHTPTNETSCFKVSTRSSKHMQRRLEKESKKAKKKAPAAVLTKTSELAPTEDSDYNREHPKLFFPAVENSVKKALEEAAEREQQQALKQDQEDAEKKRQIQEVLCPRPYNQVGVQGQAGIYDIRKDIQECIVTATIGQLLADNPLYRSQLRDLLRVRKKRLPKNLATDVRFAAVEDLGALEIEVSINGMLLSHVPVDGGAGVNVMTHQVASQLGYTSFQSTHKVVRLADGSRVSPLGVLSNICVIIGEQNFLLNFLVLSIERNTSYPILLGRPWLYGAKAKVDWRRQVIHFGWPRSKICWSQDQYRGETSDEESSYDSGEESTANSLLLEGVTNLQNKGLTFDGLEDKDCLVLQVEEQEDLQVEPECKLKLKVRFDTPISDTHRSVHPCPKDRERGRLNLLSKEIGSLQAIDEVAKGEGEKV